MAQCKNESVDFHSQKKFVEDLKTEWKLMWSERFNDKPKAEGISIDDYTTLGIERGTIIHATRDFKPLNFKEILEQQKIAQPERFIQPSPAVGGWGKFIKTDIISQKSKNNSDQNSIIGKKKKTQNKQARGWLNL